MRNPFQNREELALGSTDLRVRQGDSEVTLILVPTGALLVAAVALAPHPLAMIALVVICVGLVVASVPYNKQPSAHRWTFVVAWLVAVATSLCLIARASEDEAFRPAVLVAVPLMGFVYLLAWAQRVYAEAREARRASDESDTTSVH
jgi:hypothetical protein